MVYIAICYYATIAVIGFIILVTAIWMVKMLTSKIKNRLHKNSKGGNHK